MSEAASVGSATGKAFAGFLLGAMGMFATMYATQAILPELSRAFDVSPSTAGLSVSVVVVALATGGYVWGPLSDRIGRPRTIRLASLLLVPPTIAVALAPTFPALLACRFLQGLCMPGLLIVGAPYVYEAFVPAFGARAMGYYVSTLVVGGLVGRLGVALLAALVGWRVAIGLLVVFPVAAIVAMRRGLPGPQVEPRRGGGLAQHARNPRLLAIALCAGGIFFAYTGCFSFVTFRLEAPPFSYSSAAASLVFVLWIGGLLGPLSGRIADRYGWRLLVLGTIVASAAGMLISLSDALPVLVLGLAVFAVAMFASYTGNQMGVGELALFDRGAATAIYFSIYYACGALGAYVPGLAWETWGWWGVTACTLGALAVSGAALAVAASGPRAAA